jgi:hypothetical protein
MLKVVFLSLSLLLDFILYSMKIGRIARWIILIGSAVPAVVIGFIVYGYVGRSRLIEHHQIGSGMVYSCTLGVKGSPNACNVRYRYGVDDRSYEGATLFSPSELQYEDCLAHLAGHAFPVVYETGNSGNSVLLLSPVAGRLYGYSFPDSLNWVSQYVHEK